MPDDYVRLLFKELGRSLSRVEKKVDVISRRVSVIDRSVAIVKNDLKHHIDTPKTPPPIPAVALAATSSGRFSRAPRAVKTALFKNLPTATIIRALTYIIIAAGMAIGYILFGVVL